MLPGLTVSMRAASPTDPVKRAIFPDSEGIVAIYGVFDSVDEPLSVESLFNMNSTSARCFLMYS
jgi:hypothetical protein